MSDITASTPNAGTARERGLSGPIAPHDAWLRMAVAGLAGFSIIAVAI